jgi:hypothetical protein
MVLAGAAFGVDLVHQLCRLQPVVRDLRLGVGRPWADSLFYYFRFDAGGRGFSRLGCR